MRPAATDLIRPLLLEPPVRDELFPYQREGADWLKAHETGVLADDMGLGKTLQTISATRELINSGEVPWGVVVAPRSVLATWEDEIARWAPELTRIRVTPTGVVRQEAWETLVGRVHILLTNYEQLRTVPDALADSEIPLLIADEAHRLRNAGSQISSGLRNLKFRRFWALTGTPIERDSEDLATLMSFVEPRRFSPDDSRLPASVLRGRAKQYILRRRKVDVLQDLPEVLERREVLDLLPAQRSAYNDALRRVSARRYSPDDTLRLLGELRQICDFDPMTKASCKVERICEIVGDIQVAGEKAVVFSTLVEPLQLLDRALKKSGIPSEVFTGQLGSSERDKLISRFRSDEGPTALLATTWVAGVGLTLTEANHVVFLNEWWNPSTNDQARDRVVRIGQQRGVQVYKFRCRGTVEEAVERVLSRKEALFEGIVDRLAESDTPDAATVNRIVAELPREI